MKQTKHLVSFPVFLFFVFWGFSKQTNFSSIYLRCNLDTPWLLLVLLLLLSGPFVFLLQPVDKCARVCVEVARSSYVSCDGCGVRFESNQDKVTPVQVVSYNAHL